VRDEEKREREERKLKESLDMRVKREVNGRSGAQQVELCMNGRAGSK
jgi:hypothetical protein